MLKHSTRLALIALGTLMCSTTTHAQLGYPINSKALKPCGSAEKCKFISKTSRAPSPFTDYSYQIVNRNLKVILTTYKGDTGGEVIISSEYVATRFPLTNADKTFLLKAIERETKGKYPMSLFDKCFAQIDKQPEDAYGNEEVMLATEDVGVRCFKRRYTHWYASGVRVFYPMH
ncbi:hypothetical protein L1280_000339 [Deinococcus sp. HSC-46F16]|uniref:hypothetical protein n=1 Tax=Deinococcus sp. HSC-46F16 TaxID=2910968 RepID=UPI00209E0FFA|nr:hypothetical protein [Deinococcus sp. HSC-46F16]MCP2013211.1 hypothetical protein [Deinococcus sp. HSC-46F16]